MKRLPLLLALSLVPLSGSSAVPARTATKAPAKSALEKRVDRLWEQSDAAFHKGDYPAAVALHRQIVKLAPGDIESYGVGAWLLWSLGQKAQARAFLDQGLKANPNNAEMWDTAGQHYSLEHAFGDAKNAFVKAVYLSGTRAPELLRRRMAHAAEGAGDWELALRAWTNLARDFPNSPVNKNNLARVQARFKAA